MLKDFTSMLLIHEALNYSLKTSPSCYVINCIKRIKMSQVSKF